MSQVQEYSMAVESWKFLNLAEAAGTAAVDGGLPHGAGGKRLPRPAEEGSERARLAPKKAPALVTRCESSFGGRVVVS